jgi:putative ABC transport system permease protein
MHKMSVNILKKDISRNKAVTATLFVFILLAAMLVSISVNIILTLFGSMDSLFTEAKVPHYMQMHSGEINQSEIDDFSQNNPLVKSQQTVTMLNIRGANITFGGNEKSEADSIFENAFVTQNMSFDFLLDMKSNVIQVNDGEIAVPIYHMQEYNLHIGDTVRVAGSSFDMEFVITDFVRDAQMNPSVVTSKRFVVSDGDWELMRENIGEPEYLIEFLLYDVDKMSEFEAMYQASDLPQKDTAITYPLFRLLSSLTDGILAAVIVLISVLLVAIATLCLRFTLTATIEEDYREIGVMKAIGINGRDIRRLYMIKYVTMAAAASLFGFLASFFVGGLFTANIALYMGIAPKTAWDGILPALGAVLVFLAVALFCRIVLRKFRKISAVEALRSGRMGSGKKLASGFRLSRSNFKNVNIFLGMKAVFGRFGVYGVLCVIFVICAFLMTVPLNLLNTMESPEFISYMGAGRSDIRLDVFIRQGADASTDYATIREYLENDSDVKKYAVLTTAAYKVKNSEGNYENIKVESGDFSMFPLEYLEGAAPMRENEIALSSMNAREFGKSIGDILTLFIDDNARALTVCGIYQDVTNGGKTAKGLLPYSDENVLWHMVNIDIADDISIPQKTAEYSRAFPFVKVTDMEDYVSQTLGGLIDQLSLASVFAFVLAMAISALITAMFFKMLIVKDASGIAVMRGLGLSVRSIRTQYVTRAAVVLFIGIIAGSVAGVTLGQGLGGMLITGISSMRFVINPLMSFAVCPLALAAAVGVTVLWASTSVRKINIMLIAE